MSLSAVRTIYGVHSATPYSRTNGLPYGMLRVLDGSSFSMQGELVELVGGSQPFSWDVQNGKIKAELSIKVKEFPDFLFELFLGKAPTAVTADTSGTASTITNKYGTSVVASTGIATATVKAAEKADLKFTRYIVKAVSATTVDVYALTDADFAHGVDRSFENDALKITTSALTIVQSTAVEIPDFGIELTGGAGVIALVTGDTATFEVKPVSTNSMSVTIGGSTDTYPEFGCVLVAQRNGSNEMWEVDAFRCKALGMPLGMEMAKHGEAEIKAAAFYDSTLNGVAKVRWIQQTS
jgi:hypothetical protein